MKINLTTLHFKASEALEKMVDEKVGKLFHQNEKIIHADVTLYEEGKNIVKNQYCEIVLSVPGENLFAKKSAEK